jgi:hypothetical protein
MDYFIGLYIKSPIGIRTDMGKCLICFDSEDLSALEMGRIPHGMRDPDLFGCDVAYELLRVILAVADGHDHFVHDRQDGGDGFDYRVVIDDGVADDGEAGDFHRAKIGYRQSRAPTFSDVTLEKELEMDRSIISRRIENNPFNFDVGNTLMSLPFSIWFGGASPLKYGFNLKTLY